MSDKQYTNEYGRTFIPICVWTRNGEEVARLELEPDEHYWLKAAGKFGKINPYFGHYFAVEEAESLLRFFMPLERKDFLDLDSD